MTLREALKQLTPDQYSQLLYAFDEGISSTVYIDDGYWVAVYSNAPAIDKKNNWSFGRINNEC